MRDLDERYLVRICGNCGHPGGQHSVRDGCKCGFCGGFDDAGEGYWSDRMTAQLESGDQAAVMGAPVIRTAVSEYLDNHDPNGGQK